MDMQVKVCISASDWEDLPRPLVPYHFTMSVVDGAADLPQEERLLARASRTFEFIEEEVGEEREEREETLRKVKRENVKVLQDAGESKALCLCDREVAFLESLPLSEQVQLADLLGRDELHESRPLDDMMRCLPPADSLLLREALRELGYTRGGGREDCIKQSQ